MKHPEYFYRLSGGRGYIQVKVLGTADRTIWGPPFDTLVQAKEAGLGYFEDEIFGVAAEHLFRSVVLSSGTEPDKFIRRVKQELLSKLPVYPSFSAVQRALQNNHDQAHKRCAQICGHTRRNTQR